MRRTAARPSPRPQPSTTPQSAGTSSHRGRRGKPSLLGLASGGRKAPLPLPASSTARPGRRAAGAPCGPGKHRRRPSREPTGRQKHQQPLRSPPLLSPRPKHRYRHRPSASPSPTPGPSRPTAARPHGYRHTPEGGGGNSGCPGNQGPPFSHRSLPRPPHVSAVPRPAGVGQPGLVIDSCHRNRLAPSPFCQLALFFFFFFKNPSSRLNREFYSPPRFPPSHLHPERRPRRRTGKNTLKNCLPRVRRGHARSSSRAGEDKLEAAAATAAAQRPGEAGSRGRAVEGGAGGEGGREGGRR